MTDTMTGEKLDRQLNHFALERVLLLKGIELDELEGDKDTIQKEIDTGNYDNENLLLEINDAIEQTELVIKNILVDLQHGAIGDS